MSEEMGRVGRVRSGTPAAGMALSGPVGDTQSAVARVIPADVLRNLDDPLRERYRSRLIEMLAEDDDAASRHGQLCPVWVRRNDGATIWDCNCWRLRQHQRTADKAVRALAEIGEHRD